MKTLSLIALLFLSSLAYADCPYVEDQQDIANIQFDSGNETGNYHVTYIFPELRLLECTQTMTPGPDPIETVEFDLHQNPISITFEQNGSVTQSDMSLTLTLRKSGNSFGLFLNEQKRIVNAYFVDDYEDYAGLMPSYASIPIKNFQSTLR